MYDESLKMWMCAPGFLTKVPRSPSRCGCVYQIFYYKENKGKEERQKWKRKKRENKKSKEKYGMARHVTSA